MIGLNRIPNRAVIIIATDSLFPQFNTIKTIDVTKTIIRKKV